MKEKIKHYIKEIILFIIIMIIASNAISLYKSSSLNKEKLSLTNVTLIDNTPYNFSSTKPTLVHIWAIWCPTCKLEASNIQYISKHFNVLTIAYKSGTDKDLKEWLKTNNYDFNVVNDESGFISSHFNIQAFPTTFIYNKNKELVFSDVGYTSTISLYLKMLWSDI